MKNKWITMKPFEFQAEQPSNELELCQSYINMGSKGLKHSNGWLWHVGEHKSSLTLQVINIIIFVSVIGGELKKKHSIHFIKTDMNYFRALILLEFWIVTCLRDSKVS